MKYLSASLLLVSACIAAPTSGPPPECSVDSDCNVSGGEICEQADGLCYGDPPSTQYAVVIGAPADRPDLVSSELPAVVVAPDGWMSDLQMAWPATIHGRLTASCNGCRDGAAIPATITVRRASLIAGGPEYLTTAMSVADPTTGNTDSFGVTVPDLATDDPPYQVHIEPSDTDTLAPGGPTPAEVVPPLTVTVGADQIHGALAITLTADQVRTVSGRVVDSLGDGVPLMKVSALGRVDPLRPLERVSTIAITDANGYFTVLLGPDALDVIDVVAAPPSGAIAPTIFAHDRFVGATGQLTLRMPLTPGTTHVSLPVVHDDTNGSTAPVPGARVQMATSITDPIDSQMEAIFAVDGYSDDAGHFDADVIAGTAIKPQQYLARISPPADSIAASEVVGVDVGSDGGALPTVPLGQRADLSGAIFDVTGQPVEGVEVTASPSLAFLWGLDSADQQVAAEREAPTATSNPDGTFTVWVDPALSGMATSYDLSIVPPDFSQWPRWTLPAIDGSADQDLGVVALPDHAYVRAKVLDPDGHLLPGAEVRIYEIVPSVAACAAPANCQPPAILRGSGRSDDHGIAHVTLPRP